MSFKLSSLMFPAPLVAAIGAAALTFAYIVWFYIVPRFRKKSIAYLQGPDDTVVDKLVGNASSFFLQKEVGDFDFKWVKQYGRALRLRGVLGDDVLFICDPKALQYIYHTSGYNFAKPPSVNEPARDILGRSIVYAHGKSHQRQRKALNPAFTAAQLRGFLPKFQEKSSKLAQRLQDELQNNVVPGQNQASATLNMATWLPRATLDALGDAAFDYSFRALDDGEEPVTKEMRTLFLDTAIYPGRITQIMDYLKDYHPTWLNEMLRSLPTKRRRRLNQYTNVVLGVARVLIGRVNVDAIEAKSRDVMSILARSNMQTEGDKKLTDEEMDSSLSTFILAGTETSSSTLNWTLYELSRNLKVQDEVRAEIKAVRERKGPNVPFEIADIDGMKFSVAVLKEVLRLHPIVYHMVRSATKDDVIPLATPVLTKTGEWVNQIPVGKGQKLVISICAYNRDKDVWGEDADEFNPYRFLKEEKELEDRVKVGVVSNIMTFSAGVKACIGWRFAMIEMQAILTELLERFQFLPGKSLGGKPIAPGETIKILRSPIGVMSPLVDGKPELGVQMPLEVKPVSEE